jgi:DNA-binding NarL/FixJ family response regulator
MPETKTILEIDLLTGTESVRDLTAEELQNLAKNKAETDTYESDKQAKIAARQSALAKLAALGLTEAEIAAL